MITWKDEKRKGELKSSTAHIGPFMLVVHRHIDHPPDVWMAMCFGLFDNREMASKNIDEAKCQATAILQAILEDAVKAITES